jgi:transketolase
MYLIRDWDSDKPAQGTVLVQGSNSTVNLVNILPRLDEAGVNVRVIAIVSEDLFDLQPQAYRDSLLPEESLYDLMIVSTGTRRIQPARNLGPLTDEYSLSSDWDDQWLTGGNEADVIAEARLDGDSIFEGIKRFADEHDSRLSRQKNALNSD